MLDAWNGLFFHFLLKQAPSKT